MKGIKYFGNKLRLLQIQQKKTCNTKSLALCFWYIIMSNVWNIFLCANLALSYVVLGRFNGTTKNPTKYVFISCVKAWNSGPSLMLMNKLIAKDKIKFSNNVPTIISSFLSQNCSKRAFIVSCILGTKLCKPTWPKKDERIVRTTIRL